MTAKMLARVSDAKIKVLVDKMVALGERPADPDAKVQRKYVRDLKQIAWEFEGENFQYVLFVHRMHNWWQCGDHSALIYYYHIKKRVYTDKLTLKTVDDDFGKFRWRQFITIGNIDSLKNRFERGKMRKVLDSPELIVYKLEKAITQEDMEVYASTEENKIATFNTLVVPENIYPDVMAKATELHSELTNAVVNLSEPQREIYGYQATKASGWIAYNCVRMVNARMDVAEFFREAIVKTEELNDWLAFVTRFRVFSTDANVRVAKHNLELNAICVRELEKIQKDKKGERKIEERQEKKIAHERVFRQETIPGLS